MRLFICVCAAACFSTAVSAQVPPAGQVLAPAAAAKRIDEKVTVQMLVQSTGGSSHRYLNSAADYRDAGNFTIYIPDTALQTFKKASVENPADYYKRKVIQVTGIVTLYQSKPQIRVDDPAQIKVVPQR